MLNLHEQSDRLKESEVSLGYKLVEITACLNLQEQWNWNSLKLVLDDDTVLLKLMQIWISDSRDIEHELLAHYDDKSLQKLLFEFL